MKFRDITYLAISDILMQNTSNMYNTTCLKDALGESDGYPSVEKWEIDEKLISGCAVGGDTDGQVEEGIPYVAGNTLWAVYQVRKEKKKIGTTQRAYLIFDPIIMF